jgi:hypothetical protein
MAKAKLSKMSTSTKVPNNEGIQHPHQNDVLSGRGNASKYHVGNEYFVALVKRYRKKYFMRSKKEAVELAQSVINEIKQLDPPGRFLNQHPESKCWYEISYKKMMDRVRQCLRDNLPKSNPKPNLLKEIKSASPQKKQCTRAIYYTSPARDPEDYDSDEDDEEDEGAPEDPEDGRGPRRGDSPQYQYHTEDKEENEEKGIIAPDQQRSFNPIDDRPFNEDPQRPSLVMSHNLDQQALPPVNMLPSSFALALNPSNPCYRGADVSLLDMRESLWRRDHLLPRYSMHHSSPLSPGLGRVDLQQQMAIHRLEILRLQNQALADEQFQIAYRRNLQSSFHYPLETRARYEHALRAQREFAQRNDSLRQLPP